MRARAVVRHVAAGKGMGVQFVQMSPDNRAKLNQFLRKQSSTPEVDGKSEPLSDPRPTAPPSGRQTNQSDFETELTHFLSLVKRGNYYQLLGVTADSPANQVKQKFHELARKFHPDHHMERTELLESLKELMGMLTTAYKTLVDEEKRAVYDRQLEKSRAFNLNRTKTESQMILEESHNRAQECLRAGNFVGSVVWLRKCTELAPNDASYHRMLARSLGKVASYHHEAITHFEKAIELDPWNVESYLDFAELYEVMGAPAQASALYTKALEIDPAHAKARERLSKIVSVSPA
jgi:tetratricopeptide (TPR) repeat protein